MKNLKEESLIRLIKEIHSLDSDIGYTIYVVDEKPFRTLAQNSYLWGVVYSTISKHTGYKPEEIHELCKVKFGLKTRFTIAGGMELQIEEFTMPTKMFDTKQMTDYIDSIRQWSQDSLDCYIPQPHEITADDFINSKQI